MEDRLKKFVTLVDAGSFTAAAEQLHTSQPALSSAMQKLERELKAVLLERGSHALTPAGRVAYEHGKQLQVHAQNLQTRLAELSAQKQTIRIGIIDSLAEVLFVRGKELDRIANEADIVLTIEDSARLTSALDRGEIDIAFVLQQDEYPNTIQTYKKIGDEPLVVVTTPDNLQHTQQAVSSGSLPNFLGYTSATTQQVVSRAAARQGIDINIIFSASPQVLLGLVLLGKGSAALPYYMVKSDLQAGRVKIVELGGQSAINRTAVALTRKQRTPPRAVNSMISRAAAGLHELSVEAYSDILAATKW